MQYATPSIENQHFRKSLQLPIFFIGLIWLIHIVSWLLEWELGYLGVFPRSFLGIKGILTSPLIHGDFAHLLSNSVPLLALGGLICYFYPKVATRSLLMIYFLSGLAVWLFGRSVFHIGASGVVYGMAAFLLGNGIFRRNTKSIILSLIILFFYSGMFLGVLPNQEGISWESHLMGAFIGLFASFYYKEEIELDEVAEPDPFADELPEQNRPYFLPRNIFEKTREERRREAEDFNNWTSSATWDSEE